MLLLRAFLLILGGIWGSGMVDAVCTRGNLTDNLVSLLQNAFLNAGNQGAENPTVTITQHQIVCLTTSVTRGAYSSASVIVSFTCAGVACPSTGSK